MLVQLKEIYLIIPHLKPDCPSASKQGMFHPGAIIFIDTIVWDSQLKLTVADLNLLEV